jgi:hypothetical protein
MSKKQQRYTSNAFVMAGLIAILASAALVVAIVGSTIPQASADPRFPPQEFHCFGNPHSGAQTGNPHDIEIFGSSGAQKNPHDDVECTPR